MATKKNNKRKVAKQHPLKAVAKELYLTGNFSQRDIAEELGISERTIGGWKELENWEQERLIRTNAPRETIAWLYRQLDALKRQTEQGDEDEIRIINAKEADLIVKVSNSIEKLSQRLSSSTAMEAFMKLNNLIKQSDPQMAKALLPFETEIIKQLA